MDLGAADAKVMDRAAEPIRQNVTGETWEPLRDRPRRERSQAEIQAVIGPGRIIPMTEGFGEYWNGTDYASAGVREMDLRDPMAAGMFPLVRGRYPQTADEVVVTAFLKAEVGSTIRYTRDDVPKRVVGAVVKQPDRLGIKIIGLPGSLIPVGTTTAVEESWAAERSWLVDTPAPITWNETRRINRAGVTVLSRAVLEDPPPVGDGPAQAIRGVVGQQGDQRSPRRRYGGDAGRDRGCAAGRARLRRGPAAPSQGARAHLRPGRLGPPSQAGRAGRRADPGTGRRGARHRWRSRRRQGDHVLPRGLAARGDGAVRGACRADRAGRGARRVQRGGGGRGARRTGRSGGRGGGARRAAGRGARPRRMAAARSDPAGGGGRGDDLRDPGEPTRWFSSVRCSGCSAWSW